MRATHLIIILQIWKPQHKDKSGMSVFPFTIDRCWHLGCSGLECMVLHPRWVWPPIVPIATLTFMTAMPQSTVPPSLPPVLPTPPTPTLLETGPSNPLAASAMLVTTPYGQQNARYHVPPVYTTLLPNKGMSNWWFHVQSHIYTCTQVVSVHYAGNNDTTYMLVFTQFYWCNCIKHPGSVREVFVGSKEWYETLEGLVRNLCGELGTHRGCFLWGIINSNFSILFIWFTR